MRSTLTQRQALMASRMPEKELQQLVADLCSWLGIYHHHPRDSRGISKGFPDSTMLGARLIFRELKSERGRLTPEQRDYGGKLKAAGQDWSVWTPTDWLSGRIETELRLLVGQPTLPLEVASR